MSQKNRSQLKGIFASGKIPSQQDFSDFIDSTWNIPDDGSLSGATGPQGAAGATGPFLGGDFGELYSNSSTGSFSTTLAPGISSIWSQGVVGESNGTVVASGPSSFTINNTGTYSLTVSSNLIQTVSAPGSSNDPYRINILVNGSSVPKLTFDVSYEKTSWNAFYPLSNGDVVTLRFFNPSSGSTLLVTGSLFFTILQIK